MDSFMLVKAQTKISAAIITSERINLGHPEDLCKFDQSDWDIIANTCISVDEIVEKFDRWAARVTAWEIKSKGMLH